MPTARYLPRKKAVWWFNPKLLLYIMANMNVESVSFCLNDVIPLLVCLQVKVEKPQVRKVVQESKMQANDVFLIVCLKLALSDLKCVRIMHGSMYLFQAFFLQFYNHTIVIRDIEWEFYPE